MGNPTDWIKAFVICFILLVLGFYLFPGVHTEMIMTSSANTTENITGWNKIAIAEHSLYPYAFIGGIFFVIFLVWQSRQK